jgi:hypothetical protein
MAAARRLAVERDELRSVGAQRQRPVGEAGLEEARIDPVHHHPQPIRTGCSEVELGKGAQEGAMLLAPQRDLVIVLTVGDRRRHDQEQNLAQRVHDLRRLARILDPPEMVQKPAQPRRSKRCLDLPIHGRPPLDPASQES